MDDTSRVAPAPEVVLRFARAVALKPGQPAFEQGSLGNTAFVVVAGTVKVVHHTGTGPVKVLAILGPGEVFGASSLFDGGGRSASARALTAVTLRELDREGLDKLVQSHPEVATWLIEQLARGLRRAHEAAADLVFADVPARLAQVLLDLAERLGRQDDDVMRVDHGLTQLELAQLAGASRESVNKALASFVARGWITSESRSTGLVDMHALIRRAGRNGKLPNDLQRPDQQAIHNSQEQRVLP